MRLLGGLLFTAVLTAQTSGTVVGRITDASGAVVPGAKVELVNERTGIATAATTGPDGEYTFTNVEPGSYRLGVSGAGRQAAGVLRRSSTPTQRMAEAAGIAIYAPGIGGARSPGQDD